MRSGTTIVVIRSLIAVFVAGLGIVALTDGRTVMGVLLIGLAILNVAMTVTMRRRRRQWRDRLQARRAGTGAAGWGPRP
jgi:hypothetical protein